ncbi:ThuA domain-containing protein [Cnuibacter physcomitrellae]|uniref:ThuA domain-containing protein n=1 Tax=Cnuibacter physcomitrellae TaxID=1619308 RepID=UPI002175CAFB|nr:ThuA domain-containing protein [Cnuibacter physcomitrellae]MCS5497457.1 ThuA domain-containing protein [Cnuibacter physcomitrellae]
MTRAVLFSGGEDYTDPWHPFAETSAVIADVLRAAGFRVLTVMDVGEVGVVLQDDDLLVVNAGGGQQAHPKDDELLAVLAGHSGGILAFHVAATLLPSSTSWEQRLGGRWIRGRTMHPARGDVRLIRDADVDDEDLPAIIDTVDEAYSWLRVGSAARVMYRHDYAGEMHPVVWTNVDSGVRAAYCALGHDVEAFDSPAVRALVASLARWAATPDGPDPGPSGAAQARAIA